MQNHHWKQSNTSHLHSNLGRRNIKLTTWLLLQQQPLMATPVSTATSLLFTDDHYARSSQWPHFPERLQWVSAERSKAKCRLAWAQRKAVCYMTTPPSGRQWYGHWYITIASTEASPQPHLSMKVHVSVRFHCFILLLMFVQGYKKKKKTLQTKHDNISCSYRPMLFVQASSNSMYCIYSIHSNVAITL